MSMPTIAPRRTTASNPRGRQILIAVIAVLAILVLVKLFAPHENKYEKLAHDLTIALQRNDVDAVRKYQNAETATTITRGIVGRAADRLAPLGTLKHVKEVTPADGPDRTHEFDVTFDKGAIHEKMKVDPDFKIVHFQYEKGSAVVPAATFAANYTDVQAAAQRLAGIAHRTPVMTSRTLDDLCGANAFLKCENLQRMGAFKFRGAYNCIAQLGSSAREGGVVAFSSGNHAQGVALSARLLGLRATIVMPSDAPAAKVAATRAYGAQIVMYERASMNRAELAESIALERGATIVPPFDDARVIAGAGTVALELIEDRGPLDVLLVCLGGGGLLAGCALAATKHAPGIAIYGVEPEAGDDWVQSWIRDEIVSIPLPQTIADGQRTQAPGRLTWPIVRSLCAGVVTVSDDEIRAAMKFAFERLKLVVEPSGASALAALLSGRVDVRGKRVGVTLSGGNVDPRMFAEAIAR